MKVQLLTILLLNILSISFSKDTNYSAYTIKKVNDGFYFLYIDSSNIKKNITKSTILEFKDHIMLIDLPISYNGAGTKQLIDHAEQGNEIIELINNYFPNKPLKYFLASHWHPHCISSVMPFLKNNIQVLLSQKNFYKINEMIDTNMISDISKNISIIKTEQLKIEDDFNSIIVYMIEKNDYEYLPTDEFLYFYIPKYKYFHTSCMYQRYKSSIILGKEVVSPRTEDLSIFLDKINLLPDFFICDDTFFDEENGLISADTFKLIMDKGIKFSELKTKILEVASISNYNFDSTINLILINKFPISLLNSIVYKNLKSKDYEKAIFFARVQCMINPSNPNSWDTYGETYYFMGNKEMARRYEKECKKLDKNFAGGETVWETDFKEINK